MNSTGQGERILCRMYGPPAEAGLVLATQRE